MQDGHNPCGGSSSDTPSPAPQCLALFLKHQVETANGRLACTCFLTGLKKDPLTASEATENSPA